MSGNRGAGVAVVATLCGNAEVLSLRDDSSAAGTSQPSPEKKDCSSDGEGVPGSVEAPQIQTCATHVSGTVVAAAVDKAGCVQLYHGVDNVLVFRATLPASTIGDHGAVHDRNPKSTDPFLVTAAVLSDDAEWIAVSTTDHFVHVFKINTTDLIGPIGPAIASEHDGADTDDSVHSVARHAVTLQLPTVNAIRGLPSDCVDNIVTAIAPDQWATTVASTFSDEQAPLFCFCAVESGAAPWVFATWPGHNQIFRKRAELGGGPTLTGKAWTYTSAVTALASSTDSHIAVGLSSGAVSVWNVKTGFPAPLCPGGATSAVSALEFGPAGHIIVAHAGGGHAATVDYRKGVAVPLRTDLVVAADKPLNAAIPPLLTAAVERVGGSVAAASGKENVVVAGNLDALFVAVRNRVFAFAPSNATARAVYTFDEKDRVLQILPINGGVYVVVEQAGGADNQVVRSIHVFFCIRHQHIHNLVFPDIV